MIPLPPVNQAYAMLLSDESQKGMAATTSILGTHPSARTDGYDPTALYSARNGNV